MDKEDNVLKFHSRISQKIYQKLDSISDGVDHGNLTTRVAKRIISKVRVFNYSRDLLMEKHKAGELTLQSMKMLEGRAGQQCIDEINQILTEERCFY